MRLIVVGAGGATRDLLRGLGDAWDVSVVDPDQDKLTLAESVRSVDAVRGDGGRHEVLAGAGLQEATALVAASDDDDVNLAACRIARDVGVPAVTALADDPDRLPDYRALDVAAFAPDQMAARRVEVYLEPRRVSAAAFAGGGVEALEFRIAPDSPVRGRSLGELHSESWLVVTVLRDGRLIVPHGSTTLEPGDHVTVVGTVAEYPQIVHTFTAGEARFPLDFGEAIAVALTGPDAVDGSVAEAIHLAWVSAARTLLVVHPEDGPHVGGWLLSVREAAAGLEVQPQPAADPAAALFTPDVTGAAGVIVVDPPGPGRLTAWRRAVSIVGAAQSIHRPVLVSRGSHPWSSVVVPVTEAAGWGSAAHAATDLAARGNARLIAAAVRPPPFVTEDEGMDVAEAVAQLREEAAVQGVGVRRVDKEGNPVRALDEVAGDRSLLVVDAPDRAPRVWSLGSVGHVVRRSAVSVLLVPEPVVGGDE